MSLQPSPCLQTGEAAAAPQPAAGSCPAAPGGRIPVKCRQRNRFIPVFLAGTALLSAASLVYLGIDWGKMLSRVPDIGVVFWDLAHLDLRAMCSACRYFRSSPSPSSPSCGRCPPQCGCC